MATVLDRFTREGGAIGDYPTEWESDVVLADGGTVRIRPIRRDDDARLLGLYERLSDDSLYYRFFSPVSRPTATQLEALTEVDYERRLALVAELGADVVAVARYDRAAEPAEAEVAFTVQDDQQGRGIGTVLLEHLAAVARERGIERFTASTLPDNRRMLDVFRSAGWEVARRFDEGVVEVEFPIEPTPASIAVQEAREHAAEARSVARLLAPSSIAIVGASRRPEAIGHRILRNLLDFGFTGRLAPVNPNATEVAGLPVHPSILAIPEPIDVAVIAVPAPQVPAVVRQCAVKRVHGIVIVSAGFAELGGEHARVEREMVRLARRHGMRVIGPNCIGVVNTAPDVRMDATFVPTLPRPGGVALLSQSGAIGIELLAYADEASIGLSSFVSVGNKADVSGNDLLQHWEDDPQTSVILLYLESFGNPRKFSRLARRVSRSKPVLAVKSGRTPAGTRAASSHTAALAASDVAVDALFQQAGVVRVDTLAELLDTARLLDSQPLAAGNRVGIVTNGGGPGIIAADACGAAGLEVPELPEPVQRRLGERASPDASLANPVDLVASADPAAIEHAVRTVAGSGAVDMVLALFVPTGDTDPDDAAAAIARAAAASEHIPVAACFLGRERRPGALGRLPAFAYPEAAAAALGRAARYAAFRRAPQGTVPSLGGLDVEAARAIVAERLEFHPEGTWLDPDVARRLLASFGIDVVPTVWVASADGAAAAAEQLGLPVALKAGSGAIVHKSDVGAVALALGSVDEVRAAFVEMAERLGDEMGGAVVQPMARPGVETIVGVTNDPLFGGLVLFGAGGTTAELVRDTALRILPLTDLDAHDLVRSLRSSPLLFGYRGSEPVDVAALEDLLLRVGQLADALPEVDEMDLNPVLASPSGATVVDAKVHVAPVHAGPRDDVRRMRPV